MSRCRLISRAHFNASRLRPIAVTIAKRHPSHPEVPTFEESCVSNHTGCVLAPAGLPKAVQDKLCREFTATVNHPVIIERYKTLVIDAAMLTPVEFRALMVSDLASQDDGDQGANIKAQ